MSGGGILNFDGFEFDDNIKQTFNTLDIQGRVPHAVVIESRDSEKAMNLAVFLSMYAVCTEPVKPCGHCEQCHKAKNKAHADIKYVELPNDRKQNSIEQMREIIGDSVIKPNEQMQRCISSLLPTQGFRTLFKTRF
ncbi:hypothetical protein DW050_01555 [Ruminococcus sp. AF42-10]|nr:hypothetical protein DW050_01555 [Ruminococcus sp. AF42-10]RGR21300.1 hypothetical protein DWY59_09650 [Ruminococcus bromii]